MNLERARQLIGSFDKQVLVVGDVMLDRFVRGSINRFSPEAPSCPVLDFSSETTMLGGAGNVAANLGALGAKCVRLVGLVGYDDPGRELHQMLSQNKGPVDNNLVRSPERATTTKIRYVSEKDDVHLLRFDREQTHPADEREQENLLHEAERWMSVVSALVIEDYGKGVLTGRFLVRLMGAARDRGIPIFVDPKKYHWEHFKACALVKPNIEEAYAALGLEVGAEPLDSIGAKLLLLTRAEVVAITQGDQGIRLYSHEGTIHAKTKPVTAVDVSGAGDTTMAALTLARIAGASWQEALDLANTAAGLAVMKPGTSTVSAEELLSRYGEENA